ncbi:centromere protein J isoform X2 [Callorhinchus milii]|uniref:centromere protein J isoform X2 n=1 Tax=Callorhinchus milii TaxID=7868 RepID=UPI001C3F976E|nr:centromere protein J isoform X2 [Callorhinchus milii]
MENLKMSSLLNNQAQNFMNQWTTNVARAGVILNEPFSFNDTSTSPSHGLKDEINSFNPLFSPLHASTNSSCISIDSLQYEPLLDVHGLNGEEPSDFDINDATTLDLQSDGIQHFLSVKGGLLYSNEAVEQVNEPESSDELICNHPLMEKLEQLREWQQEKQEQLKKQQMEQLQRLLEEQQKVLGFITTSRDLPGQGYCFQQSSTDEPLGLNSNSSSMPCSIQQVPQSLPQINTVQPDASLVASVHFLKSNSSAASSSQQQSPKSVSRDLDHMEKLCPVNAVQQMEDNSEQENAVGLEGEFSVLEQPDPEPSVFRDVSDGHNTNENSVSAACLQSPSEKNNSSKVVSFKTLEDRPIKSNIDGKSQTFEEFLEEQIRIEDQRLRQQPQRMELSQPPSEFTDSKSNQKRIFLKRGEGLTRFSTTRASKSASVNVDKQIILDSHKSVNTTQKQVVWKSTSLNKENRFDGSNRIGNKSNPVIKPKNNPASFFKKVTVLGNRHGENTLQVEKKVSVSFGKVHDVSKIEIDSKIGKVKDVHNCTPSNTGQGSTASNGPTSLDNGETEQNYKGNTISARLNNDPVIEPEYSFETSFQKALTKWDKDKKNEKHELDEFEFLEQAADELSFSSNSSFLLKMIQPNKNRRLSSTPIKSADQQQRAQTPSEFMSSKKDSQSRDNIKFSICNGSRTLEPDSRISNVELKENFRNVYAFPVSNGVTIKSIECDLQGEDCCSRSTSDSDDLDSTLTDELEVNVKPVEYTSDEDDDPKSNCGKYPTDILNKDKSVDANLDLSDDEYIEMATVIENKRTVLKQKTDPSLFNSNCISHQVILNQEKVEFDDDQTWMDFEEAGFVDHDDNSLGSVKAIQGTCSARSIEDKVMRRKIASTKKEDVVEEINIKSIDIPPTSDLVTKLFPSLKPKPKTPSLQGLDQKLKSANDHPLGDGIQSKLLRDKMVELECEIERFRAENVTLVKLRDDREKALEDLRKEITDFERTKTEELTRLEEYKKEELRKLQKERKVFEKYASAARAIPDKKEREEIQALKQQIADLQEEVKRKELRWSSTHTRLRNQIESLTKENLEFRDEVKVMERLRLEAWKKAEAAIDKKADTSTVLLKRTEPVLSLDTRKKENSSVNRQVDKGKTIRTSRKESPYRNDTISPKVKPSRTMKSPLTPINQNIQTETEYISPNKVTPPLRSSIPQPANRFDSAEPSEMRSEPCQQFSNLQVSIQTGSGHRSSEVEEEIEEEISYPDGKVEQVLKSGRHIILFRNGTRKEISADRRSVTVTFFNGDVKEMLSDQTVIYYYADAKTTHTTYPDGLEVLQFPNNQTEKHYPDGRKEITFPDQTIKYLFTDGHEESVFPDGTIIQIQTDGNKIIEFNNGQREIHTSQYKRREYPDGTIKTVYQNGEQETKYISGRVRIKDKEGNIIMDSKP